MSDGSEKDRAVNASGLKALVDAALEDLSSYRAGPERPRLASGRLPSLLDEARWRLAAGEDSDQCKIRSVHHFACTGGTVISKCIAVAPNTVLLSEIDPLSEMIPEGPKFSPTDLIRHLRYGARPVPVSVIESVFVSAISRLVRSLHANGMNLVLRDHAHSQFCQPSNPSLRPTLLELLARAGKTAPVVTVRHPLESYLSMVRNRWIEFEPATLSEYCRRYILFLNSYAGAPVFKYEELVTEPEHHMRRLFEVMDLSYSANIPDLFDSVVLTGDSGRSGSSLDLRERKSVDENTRRQMKRSKRYIRLCERLEYNP